MDIPSLSPRLEISAPSSTSTLYREIENFDDLFVGDPVEIEKNLSALLPRAQALEDHSIYLQILSQIALAEAMQKRFDTAHQTLDRAEAMLTPKDYLARARILIERGRLFWQGGDTGRASPFLEEGFLVCREHAFDYHAINAAHLIAIIALKTEERIKWNARAIEIAEHSEMPKAKRWLGPLYNNIGRDYIKTKEYEKALTIFKKALALFEQEGCAPQIRFAKWSVAEALRLLNYKEEALDLLIALQKEYDALLAEETQDTPREMMLYARGLVYAELAEIDTARTPFFASLAYEALSQNEWVVRLEPLKLERLQELQR